MVIEFVAVEDVLDLAEADLLHLLNALFLDELDLMLALGMLGWWLLVLEEGWFAAMHAVEVNQLLHVLIPYVFGLLPA